jgi:hypothetical protein
MKVSKDVKVLIGLLLLIEIISGSFDHYRFL